jgi:hypothetical protein
MPPWVDWLDYFGADGLGRLTGLWLNFCLSLSRRLVLLLGKVWRANYRSDQRALERENTNRLSHRVRVPLRRLGWIAVSTSLTLLLWAVITWKPFWTAAGASEKRLLSAVLLLASAFWVMSLFLICFSKSRRTNVAALVGPSSDTRPRTAKAS